MASYTHTAILTPKATDRAAQYTVHYYYILVQSLGFRPLPCSCVAWDYFQYNCWLYSAH